LCLCDTLYCKGDEEKLKRNCINREWVVNCCNYCVLYCLSSRNFKLKIDRKLRETTSFAYNLKNGLGNGIYIDLENKSCSKEGIAVTSFLTVTKPTKPKQPKKHFHWYSRRSKKYPRISGTILTVILVCVWESIYRKALANSI